MKGPFDRSARAQCPACGCEWGTIHPAAESVRCGCGRTWSVLIAAEPEGVIPGARYFLVQRGGPAESERAERIARTGGALE